MKAEYAAGLSDRIATRRNCLILLTNRPIDVMGLSSCSELDIGPFEFEWASYLSEIERSKSD